MLFIVNTEIDINFTMVCSKCQSTNTVIDFDPGEADSDLEFYFKCNDCKNEAVVNSE